MASPLLIRRILLRGATAWTPTDIAGLQVWVKADSLALNDGDPVGTWADQSGNGNDLTQATAAKKPTFKTNIQNGKPVVRFDGVDDWLRSPSLTLSQPLTMLLVIKPSSGNPWFDTNTAANRQTGWLTVVTNEYNLYAGTTITSVGTGTPSAWHVLTCRVNGASSLIRADGAEVVSGNAGAESMPELQIGANTALTAYLTGDIGELILYAAALTVGEMGQLETYANTRWGVY